MNTTSVFLDTSIHIARQLHGPLTKSRIERRLRGYTRRLTGLVSRAEYRRRVLKEAAYLLAKLEQYDSYEEVCQHVIQLPMDFSKQKRKKTICLQMLQQVLPNDTDEDRTDSAKLLMYSLLTNGMREFDQRMDEVVQKSGCGCGRGGVRKTKGGNWKFDAERCDRVKPGVCGIVKFLKDNEFVCRSILAHLRSLAAGAATREITSTITFLARILHDPQAAPSEKPCTTVGDLLIALESIGISDFYTLNSRESQHLCRPLNQNLVVCPISPLRDEIVCRREEAEWPVFGRPAATDQSEQADES